MGQAVRSMGTACGPKRGCRIHTSPATRANRKAGPGVSRFSANGRCGSEPGRESLGPRVGTRDRQTDTHDERERTPPGPVGDARGSPLRAGPTPTREPRSRGEAARCGPTGEREHEFLLAVLRARDGAPVSYKELRQAGIEFPASVVSELELAGVAVDHCHTRDTAGQRQVAVRLDQARTQQPVRRPEGMGNTRRALPHAGVRESPSLADGDVGARRPVGGRGAPHSGSVISARAAGRPVVPRAIAVGALLAVLVALAAMLTGGTPRAGRQSPTASARRPAAAGHASRPPRPPRSHPTSVGTQNRSTPAATPIRPPAATPNSYPLAANLEARGHDLLLAGRYSSAVPVLQHAVHATGERLASCLQPSSSTCLTYAYALYDLGRALRLSGRPAGAVPVLERRLRIDNQQTVVAAELALARREAR